MYWDLDKIPHENIPNYMRMYGKQQGLPEKEDAKNYMKMYFDQEKLADNSHVDRLV